MTEEIHIQKSLIEQIFDEMFESIEGQEEFDEPTIKKLKILAENGNLKKAQHVNKAIR